MSAFVLTCWLVAASSPASTRYVQPSRVNVRAAASESAAVVTKLPIGTPVDVQPTADPAWCAVKQAAPPVTGFVHCALLGDKRPTLDDAKAALATASSAGANTKAYEDAVARVFFLSPSITTIVEAATARSTPVEEKDAFISLLFEGLRNSSKGSDARPVTQPWNKQRFVDLKAQQQEPYLAAAVATDPLPAVKPSLWKRDDDVFFIATGPAVDRLDLGKTLRGPDGKAEVHYAARGGENRTYSRGVELFEYLKLLDVERPRVTTGGTVAGYDGPTGINAVGTVSATFAGRRPTAMVLTDRGVVQASIAEVDAMLGEPHECGVFGAPTAVLALPRPIEGRILAALVSPSPLPTSSATKRTTVTKIGRRSWSADVDGDGTADLAALVGVRKGMVSEEMDVELSIYVANINGDWRVVSVTNSGAGDCT